MQNESAKAILSIETYLNPEIFGRQENIHQIRDYLADGKLVLIRNVFKTSFAERIFQCLDEFSDWRVYEYYRTHFHYHHHNICEDEQYPRDLLWCQQILGSDSTKSFIADLTQRDCSGKTLFSASLYLPGDHSLPHADFLTHREGEERQVAFIWHLTKNWHPEWGGDLFWCASNRYVSPSFNTLLLFGLSENTWHLVTQVSPYAQSKRLAINCWWTGKGQTAQHLRGWDDSESTDLLIQAI
jgi:hypothetical protein